MITKAEARKAAFARRKAVQGAERSAQACDALVQAIFARFGQVVAGYMPIRTEVDIRPALAELARSRTICLPVVLGEAQPLEFRIWTPEAKLIEGAFGALIPEDGAITEPDIVILPLLAFDKNGYRLGYGGGFYDRTLEQLRATKPVQAIGFAYAAQEMERVPIEPTDQPVDAIVTERGEQLFSRWRA